MSVSVLRRCIVQPGVYPRSRPTLLPAFFSTSSLRSSYEDTLPNLKIGAHTRVIFQGFTGKQATQNATQSIEWGTNIVGGVRPGKTGEHLGLPVLPSMRAAMERLKPDATGVYVAAHQAAQAIEEAIEAEIPLIVAVAEFIPLHDLLRIHSVLQTQSKSRLVGANCPGIISAVGKCRIGFQPLSCFAPGSIGIVAKSGTLSYETVASTTRAGLGQSLVIGMGGDVVAGTNFLDALKVFEHDEDTKGIIIVGEIGGEAELEAAEWIKAYRTRTTNPKPIMALVGGVQAPSGRIMGHAGAFVGPGEFDALYKIRALQDAGVVITDHPSKFGNIMRDLLEGKRQQGSIVSDKFLDSMIPRPKDIQNTSSTFRSQTRSLHTQPRRTQSGNQLKDSLSQRRSLHVASDQADAILATKGLKISKQTPLNEPQMALAISVDRTNCCPCLLVGLVHPDAPEPWTVANRYLFQYKSLPGELLETAAKELALSKNARQGFYDIIRRLVSIFEEKEAFLVEVRALFDQSTQEIKITDANMTFDDCAFRVGKRLQDVEAMRRPETEDADEVEVEKYGIVYVKLGGNSKIGTLVNGAGLAMNTNDAINNQGGLCTNFLDMGGKATSETVKASFQIVMRDPRVKTIFINIFGGLTLCDMIADGIILAYKDLGISLPVVVRLRGTNEELGQKMIAESGLPLHAFDDFGEAVDKAIELANSA
ncbi:hypothetical protein MMC25_001790 [Agyrium rufum]|nr:hypothetical protein [Agyrium rufum]